MDDEAFLLIVRRSLLAIVAAVDARFGVGNIGLTAASRADRPELGHNRGTSPAKPPEMIAPPRR